MTNYYQGFEIKEFEQCEAVPAELLNTGQSLSFDEPAKKNPDLLERYQKAGEYAAQERSLRLQLIGAIKMREASSGRKKAEYDVIADDIRLKIKELNEVEARRGQGFFSRINPFN